MAELAPHDVDGEPGAPPPPADTPLAVSKPCRAPRWRFHALCAAAAAFIVWDLSLMGGELYGWAVGFYVLGPAALAWFVLALRYFGAPDERRLGTRRWFLVAPVGGLLTIALLVVDPRLRLAWMRSDDDFGRVEADLRSADCEWIEFLYPKGTPKRWGFADRRVGDFVVHDAWCDGDATYFAVAGGFLQSVGVAHLPSGPAEAEDSGRLYEPVFTPLGGGWYSWENTFNW